MDIPALDRSAPRSPPGEADPATAGPDRPDASAANRPGGPVDARTEQVSVSDLLNGRPDQNEYRLHFSKRFRALYVEVPKTGSSTIKRALQLLEVGGDASLLDKALHDRSRSPLIRPSESDLTLLDLLRGPSVFRFGFVRNPYTRLLSCYIEKIIRDASERRRLLPFLGLSPETESLSLTDFLLRIRSISDYDRDIHWASQTYLLKSDKIDFTFIGRFENFQRDWTFVLARIARTVPAVVAEARVDHHLTQAGSHVSRYIGSRERDLIEDIYDQDFRSLNYSRDPHFATC